MGIKIAKLSIQKLRIAKIKPEEVILYSVGKSGWGSGCIAVPSTFVSLLAKAGKSVAM